MTRKGILMLGMLVYAALAGAQTIDKEVTFKTPEVNAFNKSIETPVSYFTGIPDISIPLYEIRLKNSSVPVSLSYHGGGIKVDEEATWVGLGWNLSYGGQISRKQRGMQDEQFFFQAASGQVTGASTIQHYMGLPGYEQDPLLTSRDYHVKEAKYGRKDYQPDEFYYSAPGYSGRFMLNQSQHKFVFFPKEDMSVNYNLSNINDAGFPTSSYYINTWDLKLPNGVKVTYGNIDNTAASRNKRDGDVFYVWDSWMIKRIEDQGEAISYEYQADAYSATNLSSESASNLTQAIDQSVSTTNFKTGRLQSIGFPGGNLQIATTTRQDMPTPALDEITIYNEFSEVIKKVKFYYSYFQGDYNSMPVLSYLNTDYKCKRLRLDSLKIYNGNEQPLVYKFDYYTIDPFYMPSKHSYAQDYWGYYNKKFNSTLVPATINSFGANRKVDPLYSNLFSLKTVVYPEGGKSEYIYEGNVAQTSGVPAHFLEASSGPAIINAGAVIGIQGWNRQNFETAPDATDGNGNRYFKKQFTIPSGSYASAGDGFYCASNFGGTYLDNVLSCAQNNVTFRLEKMESGGSRTLVREWQSRECFTNVFTNSYGEPVTLQAGNYEMTVIIKYTGVSDAANYNQPHSTTFAISWREFSTQPYFNVGGIRIKEIKKYSSDGIIAAHKRYSYEVPGGGKTSGKLVSVPKFHQAVVKFGSPNPAGRVEDIRLYSTSKLPLQTTAGSCLGYQYVTEEAVGTTTGNSLKTRYHFSFTDAVYDLTYGNHEESIVDPQEWLRGKLLSVQYLKNEKPVREELYEYNRISPHLQLNTDEDFVEEINMDFISWQSLFGGADLPEDFYVPDGQAYFPYYMADMAWVAAPGGGGYYPAKVPYFKRYTAFDKPSEKKTIVYDDNGGRHVTVGHSFYGSTPAHHNVTRSETINSKGQVLKTVMKYPDDMGAVSPFPAMVAENIRNRVIQTEQFVNTSLVKKTVARYSQINAPDSIQLQLGNGPLESEVSYNQYDTRSNILELQKANDVPVSYFYHGAASYPTAEIVNARQAEVAYTSFEQNSLAHAGMGSWYFIGYPTSTPAGIPMGKYCLTTSTGTSFSKGGLSAATTYKVSYWSTNGQYSVSGSTSVKQGPVINGWTCYEHTVSGVSTVTVTGTAGNIDELRLYPAEAHMTTYAYEILKGISRICDIHNRFTYYEYDALGRLIRIRDKDNNIVKQVAYRYQDQERPAGFIYRNVEKSGVFTRNDCGTGTGSSITYTVPADTYTSLISQEDADDRAQQEINTNGQSYANTHGVCTYYSVQKSGTFIHGGCDPNNSVGSAVTYTVEASAYTSTISQADADQQAQNDVDQNGQNHANTHGSCIPVQVVTVKYINATYSAFTARFTNVTTGMVYNFSLATNINYTTTAGQLPMGTYNIYIFHTSGPTGPFNMGVNGSAQTGVTSYTANGVLISNSVNNILINQ